jgi:hypothetical protein
MSAAQILALILISINVTLNPDGSGKEDIVVVANLKLAATQTQSQRDTEAKRFAIRTMSLMPGGEAWSGVTVSSTADGTVTVKGTLYFRDVTKLTFTPPNNSQTINWEKNAAGNVNFTMIPYPPQPSDFSPIRDEAKLTDAVQQFRKGYAAERGVMSTMAAKRAELFFHLPGKATGVEGFQQGSDGTLRWTLEWDKFMAAFDALVADDSRMKQCFRLGIDPLEQIFREQLGTICKARIEGPMKPQFDYVAAVNAAKEAFPGMLEQLGAPVGPAKSAAGPAPAATPK